MRPIRTWPLVTAILALSLPSSPIVAFAEPLIKLSGQPDAVPIAFSPDGKWLASGGDEGHINLWDVTSGKTIRTFRHAMRENCWNELSSLSFSPDSKLLASAGGDGNVRLWDVATGKELAALPHVSFNEQKDWTLGVFSAEFSQDGKLLVSAGREGGLKLWDIGAKKLVAQLGEPADYPCSAVFTPTGKTIVAGVSGQAQTRG